MPFGAGMDAFGGGGPLDLLERKRGRSFLGITWSEAKLLAISGVGFFMDAYDLFIVNMMYAIILVAYYSTVTGSGATLKITTASNLNWGLSGGMLKASANVGAIVGQVGFGFLGDVFGRSAVYGKELILIIISVIFIISAPDSMSPYHITVWITIWRVIMGVGIGGDYPMSSSIVSDRSHMKNRGMLLAIVFSNQGIGNLVGAALAVIVIAGYKHYIVAGDLHKLSGAWRILQGLSLIPAFAVLYFRLTLVESTRFTQARQIQDDPDLLMKVSLRGIVVADDEENSIKKGQASDVELACAENQVIGFKLGMIGEKTHNDFFKYFSEWRHLKLLLGTTICWFLVDVSFYGLNLNQSTILSAIGFTTGEGNTPYEAVYSKLMKTATGNLIITIAGFLPGYFITIFTIEKLGRKPIQLFGFAMNFLFLSILAGRFDHLKNQTAPFFVVFVFLQLSFNFGANSTTFIIPSEVFPSRIRGSAHGLSAACGKVGAILSSLYFSYLADTKNHPSSAIGQQNVFWIFSGVSALGFAATFLLPETMGRDADEIDRQELLEARGGMAAAQ